jgi:hypothetical protein
MWQKVSNDSIWLLQNMVARVSALFLVAMHWVEQYHQQSFSKEKDVKLGQVMTSPRLSH